MFPPAIPSFTPVTSTTPRHTRYATFLIYSFIHTNYSYQCDTEGTPSLSTTLPPHLPRTKREMEGLLFAFASTQGGGTTPPSHPFISTAGGDTSFTPGLTAGGRPLPLVGLPFDARRVTHPLVRPFDTRRRGTLPLLVSTHLDRRRGLPPLLPPCWTFAVSTLEEDHSSFHRLHPS